MGLLSFGTPLDWEQAKVFNDFVRQHGIAQFLEVYHKFKNQQTTCLLWGDEVEYMVISYDDADRNARLSLRVSEILEQLTAEEKEALKNPSNGKDLQCAWRPEYGRYMLEGTPGSPYGNKLQDLLQVEPNMKLRRQLVMAHMQPNEVAITITSFPRLGCEGVFLDSHYEPIGPVSRSLFVPDEVINPHARFPTLTANIRSRRGSKVAINVPIFHDIKTPKPFTDPSIPRDRGTFPEAKEAAEGAALSDHIYMDAMVFGMGCCCLQITFQACNVRDARLLYDQLATLGPIMLALTAAAPIWRGYLSDIDCRWNVIAGSVDDRTREERGLEPLKKNRFVINKSRYDSIDCYISTDERLKPEYNDLPLVYDPDIFEKLTSNGIDDLLARHIAHLFIRDPLVVYKELIVQDDTVSTDHFENIQSTNWQTMRFKPPQNSNIGWRVEFRSMEVQITDFENAAFAIFIALVVRVILSFQLNLYIPISKVDENMQVAHKRGAVLNEKFWFRKNVVKEMPNGTHKMNGGSCCGKYSSKAPMQDTMPNGNDTSLNSVKHNGNASMHNNLSSTEDEYTHMTIDEIINGKDAEFPGIIPLIHRYLDFQEIDTEMRQQLNHYLNLVQQRANGTLQTAATWIREFVHSHPDYKHDSVVSKEINYDLLKRIQAIQEGQVHEPKLLGKFSV